MLNPDHATKSAAMVRLESGDAAGVPQPLRTEIEGYNRDDCLSTLRLAEWLEECRRDLQALTGQPVPRPALRNEERDREQEAAVETAALFEALTAGLLCERVNAAAPRFIQPRGWRQDADSGKRCRRRSALPRPPSRRAPQAAAEGGLAALGCEEAAATASSNNASIAPAKGGSAGTGVTGMPIATADQAPVLSAFTAATRTV